MTAGSLTALALHVETHPVAYRRQDYLCWSSQRESQRDMVRNASGPPYAWSCCFHFSGNLTDNDNGRLSSPVARARHARSNDYDGTYDLTTGDASWPQRRAIRDLINMIHRRSSYLCYRPWPLPVAGHGDSHHLPLQISKDGHPWGDQVDCGPWELRKAIRRSSRERA